MKAITYHEFGPIQVLKTESVPAQVVPAKGVLVNVKASSLNVINSRSRRGEMSPFVNKKFPKTPGVDFAGVVSAIGAPESLEPGWVMRCMAVPIHSRVAR